MKIREPALVRLVCALGVTMIIAWGTIFYAFGVLATRMINDSGMSRAFGYGCFSAALIASGLVAPAAGKWIDRVGGRRMMTIGSLLTALGFLLLAWSPTTFVFALAWIVLGASIPLTLYDPAFATVTAVAGGKKARALIVQITLFGGFASTVFWPLTHMLDETLGWRATWLVYAVLSAFVCAPLHYFVLPSSRSYADERDSSSEVRPEEPLVPGQERGLAMGLMALLFASNNFMLSGMSAHMMPLLGDLGLTPGEAVALGAIIGPCQVAGRLMELFFGHSMSPIAISAIATFVLMGALGLATTLGVSGASGLAFASLYGACNGLITVSRGTLPLLLFGRAGYGSTLGRLARPSLVLAAVAPFAFALIIEAFRPMAGLVTAIAATAVSFLAVAGLALRYGMRASKA